MDVAGGELPAIIGQVSHSPSSSLLLWRPPGYRIGGRRAAAAGEAVTRLAGGVVGAAAALPILARRTGRTTGRRCIPPRFAAVVVGGVLLLLAGRRRGRRRHDTIFWGKEEAVPAERSRRAVLSMFIPSPKIQTIRVIRQPWQKESEASFVFFLGSSWRLITFPIFGRVGVYIVK